MLEKAFHKHYISKKKKKKKTFGGNASTSLGRLHLPY